MNGFTLTIVITNRVSNVWPPIKSTLGKYLKPAFRLDDPSSNVSIHLMDLLSNEMFEINKRIENDKNWMTRLTWFPSGKMSRLLETEIFGNIYLGNFYKIIFNKSRTYQDLNFWNFLSWIEIGQKSSLIRGEIKLKMPNVLRQTYYRVSARKIGIFQKYFRHWPTFLEMCSF